MMLVLIINYLYTYLAAFIESDFPYNDLQNLIIDEMLCVYLKLIFNQVSDQFMW